MVVTGSPYWISTSRILRVNGWDWEETARSCAAVETGFVSTCFLSFGRDATGTAHHDAAEVGKLCAIARPYGGEPSCILGAAMTMTANDTGGRRAARFCDGVQVDTRPACYYAMGSLLGRFEPTVAASVAECRTVTSNRALASSCVRGGRDYMAKASRGLVAPLPTAGAQAAAGGSREG